MRVGRKTDHTTVTYKSHSNGSSRDFICLDPSHPYSDTEKQCVNIRAGPIGGYLSENFSLSTEPSFWIDFQKEIKNTGSTAFIMVDYKQQKRYCDMNLSEKAEKIRRTPNAGGSSVESEVLSYELLHKAFGAMLLKTEMEIDYFPTGGSITDYTCKIFNNILGVSVTRAWKYQGEFEQEDAEKLLKKKLKGIIYATRNSVERWHKQILHIWTTSAKTANLLFNEYQKLSKDLTSDTVVLTTVVKSHATMFTKTNCFR